VLEVMLLLVLVVLLDELVETELIAIDGSLMKWKKALCLAGMLHLWVLSACHWFRCPACNVGTRFDRAALKLGLGCIATDRCNVIDAALI
jgi:hypothetical protein